MKIITHGYLKEEEIILRFTCCRCGCVFDAEKGEYRSLQRKGEYRCTCPECGSEASEYSEKAGNKVLHMTGMDYGGVRTGQCPHCGERVNDYDDFRRCRKCGKGLVW